ncbi:MAG: aminoglycoside phosphotransferase family protein [Geodermatophilaceae bacterium]|nr:aminoglycoside phosphotransferase family protein [Geodermatophilaceae bacterium]MDQ3456779.1 aminoglycoside phosphotransferase family protein [Actinomycetota bacterium]
MPAEPRPRHIEPSAAAVARAFDLGTPVAALDPVGRAWSHSVYRLPTERGEFAVKVMRDPWASPRWRDWLAAAWEFERTAYAAGIAMPEPVPNPVDGGCVAVLHTGATVRVHRWVPGRPTPTEPVGPLVAAWVGRTLAALHGLAVQPRNPSVFPVVDTDNVEAWAGLVAAARGMGMPWTAGLVDCTDTVEAIADLALAARARSEATVMSHNDVDQKNLVLTTAGPVLCDWDVAAPAVPRRELADVALSMGDWSNAVVARMVVRSYEEQRGWPGDFEPSDLGPTLLSSVDWLTFNVERALGRRGREPTVIALGRDLVPGLLAALPRQLGVALRVEEFLGP